MFIQQPVPGGGSWCAGCGEATRAGAQTCRTAIKNTSRGRGRERKERSLIAETISVRNPGRSLVANGAKVYTHTHTVRRVFMNIDFLAPREYRVTGDNTATCRRTRLTVSSVGFRSFELRPTAGRPEGPKV